MRRRPATQPALPRQYNASYYDSSLPRATTKQALLHYVASAFVYGLVVLFLSVNPWFRDLLRIEFRRGYPGLLLYHWAYLAYLLIAPLYFFIVRPPSLWVSKNLRIIGYFARLLRWSVQSPAKRTPNAWRATYEEKHAMMFLLIKIFYGPLMINSALLAYNQIPPLLERIQAHHTLLNFCDKGYRLFVLTVFLLDSTMGAVGYHTEAGLLRNRLRYAETNPLHILVCVMCYPPFNMATIAILGPSNHDYYILFAGNIRHPMTWVLRGLGVFFLSVLLATSLSLFTRAGNLSNRGIVHWGPYSIIRHPGYIAKNLFWLTTLIPAFIPSTADQRFTWGGHLLFCSMMVLGVLGWGTMYFLRAITEEKLLMRDPEYVAYCRKVKYRFIPGVY